MTSWNSFTPRYGSNSLLNKEALVVMKEDVMTLLANLPPSPSEGGGETPSPLGRVGEEFFLGTADQTFEVRLV